MRHNRAPRRTMPMHLSSRNMHHIAHHQLPRRLALRAHQTRSHCDSQNLAALVRVPKCAGSRSKADIVAHAVVRREDRVHVYCTSEGLRGLLGGRVGLVGGADELHFGQVVNRSGDETSGWRCSIVTDGALSMSTGRIRRIRR